jgi:hypothetical protein
MNIPPKNNFTLSLHQLQNKAYIPNFLQKAIFVLLPFALMAHPLLAQQNPGHLLHQYRKNRLSMCFFPDHVNGLTFDPGQV